MTLRDVLRSWADELDALVPLRWRARRLPQRAIVLRHVGSGFEAARIGGGKVIPLGPVDLARPHRLEALQRARLPFVLRLAPDQALQTTDTLPPAAEADLGAIVGNRLDALGPWPAGQCRFDQEIVDRKALEGMTVRVTMAPRRLVDDLVARLAEGGIEVDHVDIADAGPWAPPRIDLLRSGEIRAAGLPWGRLAAGVAVLSLAAGAGIAVLAWRDAGTLAGQRAAVAALEEDAAGLAPLRERLAALDAQAEALRARGAAAPSALVVLDDLSRILPDDAWLEELRLAGDTIQIGGFTADAAPLLRLLEDDPRLERAEFRSASTRTTVTLSDSTTREVDRFSLSVVARRDGGAP